MLKRRGPVARLCLWMVVGSGVVLGAMIWLSSYLGGALLQTELKSRALLQAVSTVNRIGMVTGAVQKVVQSGVAALDVTPLSAVTARHLLDHMVGDNSEVYGATLALKPGGPLKSPYVYRAGDTLAFKDLGENNYQYETWDWFTQPRDEGQPVWTDPYFDEGGGQILMVTYSVPWFGPAHDFRGILTSDVSLAWLSDLVQQLPLGKDGYGFLITHDGTFVAHPDHGLILKGKVLDLAAQQKDPLLAEAGQRMMAGESSVLPIGGGGAAGKGHWLAFAPVPNTGWSLGLAFGELDTNQRLVALTQLELLVGVLGVALLLLVALVAAGRADERLKSLDGAA